MREICNREQQRHKIFAPSHVSRPLPDCQAVSAVRYEFLGGQFLVGEFRAQGAHVTQATRPNQRTAAFRSLVVFLGEILDLGQRVSIVR